MRGGTFIAARGQPTRGRPIRGPKHADRCHQLVDEAHAANAEGVDDLEREYDFDLERDAP